MDAATLKVYSANADHFIESYKALRPQRIYELAATFFHRSARTVDVGCGSGRDLAHLREAGFTVEGIDAVPEFVHHVQAFVPSIPVRVDQLPELKTVSDHSFENVLVSAVLMHLPASELISAVMNLLRITQPGGRLIVSTKRRNPGEPERDGTGRLHTSITAGKLSLLFEAVGAKTLFYEEHRDENRQEVTWDNFVFESRDLNRRTGLEALQEIITKDKKTSSYKLALIRSLCQIARFEPGVAFNEIGRDHVWISLKRVAFYWLKLYLPLVDTQQISANRSLAFNRELRNLSYRPMELGRLINDYDEGLNRSQIDPVLRKIAATIVQGPLRYIGDSDYGVFEYLAPNQSVESRNFGFEQEYGFMKVPITIWHDLILFGPWLEDSVVMRWAEFSENFNPNKSFAELYKLLTMPSFDERTTHEVRRIFEGKQVECTWSGNQTRTFEIDHAIPFSFWKNNDLWNLLPATSRVNREKSDSIPHPALVAKRKDALVHYWSIYKHAYPARFEFQLQKSHRVFGQNWENGLYLSFLETITRLSYQKVLNVWVPR